VYRNVFGRHHRLTNFFHIGNRMMYDYTLSKPAFGPFLVSPKMRLNSVSSNSDLYVSCSSAAAHISSLLNAVYPTNSSLQFRSKKSKQTKARLSQDSYSGMTRLRFFRELLKCCRISADRPYISSVCLAFLILPSCIIVHR